MHDNNLNKDMTSTKFKVLKTIRFKINNFGERRINADGNLKLVILQQFGSEHFAICLCVMKFLNDGWFPHFFVFKMYDSYMIGTTVYSLEKENSILEVVSQPEDLIRFSGIRIVEEDFERLDALMLMDEMSKKTSRI